MLAAYAFHKARELGFHWMKAFAIGVFLLGLGQILCKVVIQGILGGEIGEGSRFGTILSFVGLLFVMYSILEAVDHPHKKRILAIAIILGAYYAFGAIATLGGFSPQLQRAIRSALGNLTIPIMFYVPHILYQSLIPFLIGYLMLELYKETKDRITLLLGLGIIIYGTASIVVVAHLAAMGVHGVSAALKRELMSLPLLYDVTVRIIGLALIMVAYREIGKASE